MTAEYKLTLPAITSDKADSDQKKLLDQACAALGFIPNMYSLMVNSPGLLETYLQGYAAFREASGFTPIEQEVVLLTISRENNCDYCMAAHSVIADSVSNVPADITEAIRNGSAISDQKLASLSEFTQVMVSTRGLPAKKAVELFLNAGYSERHILEIILAIAIKTMSNYSNHLFHTEVDKMFTSRLWTKAGGNR